MLVITPTIVIDENELREEFVRASGPGGQNVNKVATAVQLRFDVRRSAALPEAVCERLIRLAGSRLTVEGELIVEARRFRTQEQNRRDARRRLADLIRRAAQPPKLRQATRPPAESKRRRLDAKRRRGAIKRLRRVGPAGDE